MGDLTDETGVTHKTDEKKAVCLQDHHLRHGGQEIGRTQDEVHPIQLPPPHIIKAVEDVLKGTYKNSAPGPDGVSYRIIKLLQNTPLVQAVLSDIVGTISTAGRAAIPGAQGLARHENGNDTEPGKDHSEVNGWRPIALGQCVGKIGEKLMAKNLRETTRLFHNLQYGTQVGPPSIDALMLTKHLSEQSVQRPNQRLNHATSSGKDIVNAFDNANKGEIIKAIGKHLPHITSHVERFIGQSHFEICWVNKARGSGKLNKGTPQYSPRSPVLWCISLAKPLKSADLKIAQMPRIGPIGRPHLPPLHPPIITVPLFSYVHDVTPP